MGRPSISGSLWEVRRADNQSNQGVADKTQDLSKIQSLQTLYPKCPAFNKKTLVISRTRNVSKEMRKGVSRHQHSMTLMSDLSDEDIKAAVMKTSVSNDML